jgi:hypothetical protein
MIMGAAIGYILPDALGIAISTVPIIAIILILFTRKAKSNGLAYLLGWIAGLALLCGIVFALASLVKPAAPGAGPDYFAAIIKVVLGLLLVLLGFKQWSSRPKNGEQPKFPAWMATLDTITPPRAFALAVFLGVVNTKNIPIVLSAVPDLTSMGLGMGQEMIVLGILVLLGSVLIAVPVLANIFFGSRTAPVLTVWKSWLVENNHTVLFLVFLLIGVMILGKGIEGMFS